LCLSDSARRVFVWCVSMVSHQSLILLKCAVRTFSENTMKSEAPQVHEFVLFLIAFSFFRNLTGSRVRGGLKQWEIHDVRWLFQDMFWNQLTITCGAVHDRHVRSYVRSHSLILTDPHIDSCLQNQIGLRKT